MPGFQRSHAAVVGWNDQRVFVIYVPRVADGRSPPGPVVRGAKLDPHETIANPDLGATPHHYFLQNRLVTTFCAVCATQILQQPIRGAIPDERAMAPGNAVIVYDEIVLAGDLVNGLPANPIFSQQAITFKKFQGAIMAGNFEPDGGWRAQGLGPAARCITPRM